MDVPHPRWSIGSAAVGLLAWLVVPCAPFGSIEHVFLFAPLVGVPLALLLLSSLGVEHAAARRLQLVTALPLLVSFALPRGALAGGLAVPWLLIAAATFARGLAMPRRTQAGAWRLNLLAGRFFFLLGAAWLVASRLGVGPRGFSPLTVLLAAVHFHFSGFILQTLIVATGRSLPGRSKLGTLHRGAAIGATAGIVSIAVGNVASSPLVKSAGVVSMVLSGVALAVTMAAVARATRSSFARWALAAAALSLAGGMLGAAAYGAAQALSAPWMDASRMVLLHGVPNALGFTLCGLGGHLVLQMNRLTAAASCEEASTCR